MRSPFARFTTLSLMLALLLGAKGQSLLAASIQEDQEKKPIPHAEKKSAFTRDGELSSSAMAATDYGDQIYYEHGSVAQGQLAELIYATPASYPCGYTFTAVLTPLSGDADLYLHQRVGGTWQKLRESVNGSTTTDSFSFTCADINSSATNVDLDAKGYTAAAYDFSLYRKATSSSFQLKFPLQGYTKTSAPVQAVMDFDTRWNYITTRTGETGDYWSGCLAYVNGQNVACSQNNEAAPWAYKRPGGSSWNVAGFSYDDGGAPGTNVYMWYDNHRGYDYAVTEGTDVLAAADGEVTDILPSMGQVEITHSNGYKTYYLHMNPIVVNEGDDVDQGEKIGDVSDEGAPGAIHLHFGVYDSSGNLLDPYGRTGLYGALWQ